MASMSVANYVLAALGLALLMIVHESGHYFAARRYGMRVTKFSIGFGPTIWRHQPKSSPTVFQIALIPFLAYVQIAGMNPYEDQDDNDKGSYTNASLWARIVTITAGPLANYLFATVLFFFGFLIGGQDIPTGVKVLSVDSGGAAAAAGMHEGDVVRAVGDTKVVIPEDLTRVVGAHSGDKLDLLVERDGKPMHMLMTPQPKGSHGEGRISVHISTMTRTVKVGVGEAAVLGITEPPKVVVGLVVGLARMITGKDKLAASGPVGIVKETAAAVHSGAGDGLKLLAAISAYLGGFNLLPFPALDGGRLLFLGFEAASRRKPARKVEALVHAIGLAMMLTLIAIVTYTDIVPKH